MHYARKHALSVFGAVSNPALLTQLRLRPQMEGVWFKTQPLSPRTVELGGQGADARARRHIWEVPVQIWQQGNTLCLNYSSFMNNYPLLSL